MRDLRIVDVIELEEVLLNLRVEVLARIPESLLLPVVAILDVLLCLHHQVEVHTWEHQA